MYSLEGAAIPFEFSVREASLRTERREKSFLQRKQNIETTFSQ